MFELILLLVGAMPFIVGVMAIRKMRKGKDTGSDDPPPPPDPQAPQPIVPSAPEVRRSHRHQPVMFTRDPVRRERVAAPRWNHRVKA